MTTVREAARLLHALDVRHLPVVDEDGVLVGMLSDRDLRGASLHQLFHGSFEGNLEAILDAPVSTVMSSDVLQVDVEADAAEIVDLMLDHKVGAVPVVDAEGALVGIVSYMDVLRELPVALDGDRP